MVTELERRWKIDGHPGAIRFLAWLNEANMASYCRGDCPSAGQPSASGRSPRERRHVPAAARAYRYKYGFGLNWEQEVAKNIGMFSRLGWNDGHEEAWTYTDANWTASLGVSVKGRYMQAARRHFRPCRHHERHFARPTRNSWRPAAWAYSTATAR